MIIGKKYENQKSTYNANYNFGFGLCEIEAVNRAIETKEGSCASEIYCIDLSFLYDFI